MCTNSVFSKDNIVQIFICAPCISLIDNMYSVYTPELAFVFVFAFFLVNFLYLYCKLQYIKAMDFYRVRAVMTPVFESRL